MTSDPLPDDVRRFLVAHIDSVPALEALLLMRKSRGHRWTTAGVAAELYMRPQDVAPILADLSARGLCASGGGDPPEYWWQPATPDIEALLERTTEIYTRYLVPVTNLIHSKPRASVRQFSDAFRLRSTE
jgi:hypothetical protein